MPLLLEHFLDAFLQGKRQARCGVQPPAMKLLMDYDWPGNVRELENVVERAVVLVDADRDRADLLPESVRSKEIVRGVRLQMSEFMPPLPGETSSRTGGG